MPTRLGGVFAQAIIRVLKSVKYGNFIFAFFKKSEYLPQAFCFAFSDKTQGSLFVLPKIKVCQTCQVSGFFAFKAVEFLMVF